MNIYLQVYLVGVVCLAALLYACIGALTWAMRAKPDNLGTCLLAATLASVLWPLGLAGLAYKFLMGLTKGKP